MAAPKLLRALSVGAWASAELARAPRGHVHSVFSRAVNVELASGALVAVLARGAARAPGSIDVERDEPLDALGLEPGAHARFDDASAMLAIGDALAIDLAHAAIRDHRLAAAAMAPEPHRARAIATARASATPDATLRAHAEELTRALSVSAPREANALERAVHSLVGLGQGLTPAGDDVLLGAAAVLDAARAPAFDALGTQLVALAHRTTSISAALLHHAAERRHAEATGRLARALLEADDGALADAVARAAAIGATSGRDTILGACAAASALASVRADA